MLLTRFSYAALYLSRFHSMKRVEYRFLEKRAGRFPALRAVAAAAFLATPQGKRRALPAKARAC